MRRMQSRSAPKGSFSSPFSNSRKDEHLQSDGSALKSQPPLGAYSSFLIAAMCIAAQGQWGKLNERTRAAIPVQVLVQ